MKVGFIGLGNMGLPMAGSLAAAGHELTVWNRTESKAAPLKEKGRASPAAPRRRLAARRSSSACWRTMRP
nr:NAD(P)-binding domain-containing protein [Myxococcus sp. MxC21-1]